MTNMSHIFEKRTNNLYHWRNTHTHIHLCGILFFLLYFLSYRSINIYSDLENVNPCLGIVSFFLSLFFLSLLYIKDLTRDIIGFRTHLFFVLFFPYIKQSAQNYWHVNSSSRTGIINLTAFLYVTITQIETQGLNSNTKREMDLWMKAKMFYQI